jgi:hypothetical protein
MERTVSEMSLYHEVIEALIPLIQAFDQLGISYYIGGARCRVRYMVCRVAHKMLM